MVAGTSSNLGLTLSITATSRFKLQAFDAASIRSFLQPQARRRRANERR
jgi:hypothetical protein